MLLRIVCTNYNNAMILAVRKGKCQAAPTFKVGDNANQDSPRNPSCRCVAVYLVLTLVMRSNDNCVMIASDA